ncbi:MAG: flagellar biosynthetic protein FliO [Nitrospirae bacterium YQR-1]
MTAAVIQMVFALGVVIFIIYGISYYMKKRNKQGGFLSVKEYLPLGPKRGIAMVKVGAEFLILAVTPNDLRLLKTIKELPQPEQDFHTSLSAEVVRLGDENISSAGLGSTDSRSGL